MPSFSATDRAPAAVHSRLVETSASHPSAAAATVSNCAAINPSTCRRRSSSDRGAAAVIIARTDSPKGTRGTPKPASRWANSSSGGAHIRTWTPSACNCTASPTSGSTPPRESYVDNNTRIRYSGFRKLWSRQQILQHRLARREPPGAPITLWIVKVGPG
jgi:hypothetical protein